MASLREKSPEKIAGRKVLIAKDYKESKTVYLEEDKEEKLDLPKSNVLQYQLEGDAKLTIRPSGTEPKLKFYFAVREENKEEAEKAIAEFKEKVMAEIDELMNSF